MRKRAHQVVIDEIFRIREYTFDRDAVITILNYIKHFLAMTILFVAPASLDHIKSNQMIKATEEVILIAFIISIICGSVRLCVVLFRAVERAQQRKYENKLRRQAEVYVHPNAGPPSKSTKDPIQTIVIWIVYMLFMFGISIVHLNEKKSSTLLVLAGVVLSIMLGLYLLTKRIAWQAGLFF